MSREPVVREDRGVPAPLRVVIADDHGPYRLGLSRAISRCPALELVGEAHDGPQVLELVRATAPDVAVVDVRMPGLDGLEVARRLAGDAGGTAVVLITGGDTAVLASAAQEAGARHLLSKDLSRQEICRRLLALR